MLWPMQIELRGVVTWSEDTADTTDRMVDLGEVVGHSLRAEDVVTILSICEVVVRQVGA